MVTTFLLRSLFISALMLAYYWLALRDRKLHIYSRIYLLTTVVASLVAPFLHFQWFTLGHAAASTQIRLLQVIASGQDEVPVVVTGNTPVNIPTILYTLYALVAATFIIVAIRKIVWIYRLKSRYTVTKMDGYDMVHTDLPNAPFSFARNLFWKEGIDPASETGQLILQHELTHIRQRHTLDKLFLQLVVAVCWINPFYWIIRKELSLVHEYLADEHTIKDNDTAAFARMLLLPGHSSALSVLMNPFFHSSIKKRICMLKRTNKTSYATLRKAMILPLLAIPVLLFSFKAETGEVVKAKHTVHLVLDAAHGGADMGAICPCGATEKDLVLRVCNKMAAIAKEYDVDVTLTRKGDNTMKLEERVATAKTISDGIFVSIHVNQPEEGEQDASGYEVIVSHKSPQYAQSQMLASAIAAKLGESGRPVQLVDKGLVVLKTNDLPAVAIECGYMSNTDEVNALQNDAKLEKLCRSLLSSIVTYSDTKR